MSMTFNINKKSTYPKLRMGLIKEGSTDFNKFYDMLENSAVTFSMRNESTGVIKVANKAAEVEYFVDDNGYRKYHIVYTFTEEETDTPGSYLGEFDIKFFDYTNTLSGTLIAPIGERLTINIQDSFIKSEVVYL